MSNYDFITRRKRQQHLFIVEGNHEKNEMLTLLLQCFPEMNIREENIIIYGTNIFALNNRLIKEYGEDWETVDVDLPYVVSKMKELSKTWHKENFVDIFLIFDYEIQDTYFSPEVVCKMQEYFSDETDVGKLYINYPMVESYLDTFDEPQRPFAEKRVLLPIKRGKSYKSQITNSPLLQAVELPQKIDDILEKECKIGNTSTRKMCVEEILELKESDTLMGNLQMILDGIADERSLETKKRLICDKIRRIGYTEQNITYFEYMANEFCKIICMSIRKANRIQTGDYDVPNTHLKQVLLKLDAMEILKEQNRRSKDAKTGFVWVLNTSMLIVPDYAFDLLKTENSLH